MPVFRISRLVITRVSLAAALFLCLAACAARQVTPIAMSQTNDDRLSCSELAQQIASNQATAVELLQADKRVEQGNTAKIVASVVFSGWIALSIDLSNEEQIKMRSLVDRNDVLQQLSSQKGCPKQ